MSRRYTCRLGVDIVECVVFVHRHFQMQLLLFSGICESMNKVYKKTLKEHFNLQSWFD